MSQSGEDIKKSPTEKSDEEKQQILNQVKDTILVNGHLYQFGRLTHRGVIWVCYVHKPCLATIWSNDLGEIIESPIVRSHDHSIYDRIVPRRYLQCLEKAIEGGIPRRKVGRFKRDLFNFTMFVLKKVFKSHIREFAARQLMKVMECDPDSVEIVKDRELPDICINCHEWYHVELNAKD